jgi:integrase
MIEEGILAKWLSTYSKKSTKGLYLSSIKHFFTCIYGGDFSRPDSEYESLAANFISNADRDWMKDLLAYAVYLGERPPKTAMAYMAAVKSFLEYGLDIELSRKQMKVVRSRLPKGKRARTIDGDLTRERLRQILTHCDVKGKALFLFLASSGIRIGEALKLQQDDVDLTTIPVKVTVRGECTKAGDNYRTFISSEAKEALDEWLKVRDSYLQSATKKGRGLSKLGNGQGVKSVNDKRLFPFSMLVAHSMWTNATKKTELDDRDTSTNRRKFHIHMLRKFFRSQMGLAGVPRDIIELIGHTGYLDDAYRRYNFEQLAKEYVKGEPYLLLSASAEGQTIIKSELDTQRQELADLTRKLTDSNALTLKLMDEKNDLAKKQSILEQKVTSLEKLYDKFFQMKPEAVWNLMQAIEREHEDRERKEQLKQTKEAWAEEKKKKLAKT